MWTDNDGAAGGPIIAAGLIWTIGSDSAVHGLNPANGKEVVSIPFGASANHFPTPSVGDGLLLLPGTDQVLAFMGPAGRPPPHRVPRGETCLVAMRFERRGRRGRRHQAERDGPKLGGGSGMLGPRAVAGRRILLGARVTGGAMADRFDVIVVGARCAGSPLATLLARAGLKVAVVERAEFPKDTLSTHIFQAPAINFASGLGCSTGCLKPARERIRRSTSARRASDARLMWNSGPATTVRSCQCDGSCRSDPS